jgi:hypothetical protein
VAVAISHTASFEYTAVDTDHSEAGVAIGSAAADRLVFVLVSGLIATTGNDINSMTIGGVSASRTRRDQFEYVGLGAFDSMEVWWAAVPTGTTATIAFVHDADYLTAKFSVYAVTGADTSTPVSDSDFATRSDALTNALSVSVDVPADGGGIGVAAGGIYATSVTTAWTYLTENLDNDLDIGGGFIGFSSAAAISASESLGQAVTATLTGTGASSDNGRGLTVVTIAALSVPGTAAASTSGTGTATGSARSVASTPASTSGTGTATAAARSVASAAAFAEGTGTLTVEGEAVSESVPGFASGSGNLTAVSAVVASAAGFAAGSGTVLGATPEPEAQAAVTYPPVGGGGAFGPTSIPGKQRFRMRKEKSHPKVITVRIGDWPEDPQIILERQEESEREAFHRSLAARRDEVVAEHIDEDEQALLEILAFAA